ncbi:ATP-dependent DNA helicase PIF1-like [Dendronephthya gigantea]|uniref:ATP-dependent DNA helicase PIF1-like n=1 Tax=Dendronephthya gigantea TaxID=151771 RepID=UPI00106C5EE6|nr:ATP-dependent DNA helicase PIF1-like [Dendronephthya gigantea]
MNIRTDDGMTNGASNIVKLVQLNQPNTPSGIIWVLFDQDDVGRKTRQENRGLYTRQAVQPTWTPIKPVTTQFPVGRTKSAQVVRKQFPLRLAAAKTVHRSQGDTQTQIVVNLNTKRAVSHIHYVALSRVTTMEGLYVSDLGEDKIAVDNNVVTEMQQLRTDRMLELCFTPLYNMDDSNFNK